MNTNQNNPKLIRITTVPQSLQGLLRGQLQFMSENGFDVIGISSSGTALNEVSVNEGVRVHSISMTRKITPLKDIVAVIQLYYFLKKEKPSIVHTHTPKAGIVGMFAAWMAGVPHRLHTVAGLPLMEAIGKKRSLLNLVEKLTYRFANKVYPNSKGLYDFIIAEKLAAPNKLTIIGQGSSNGIDTQYFNPVDYNYETILEIRRQHGIVERAFVFIFVGRLVGDKGINELVAAFIRLMQQKKQADIIKLLLVGPFEENLDPLKPETVREIEINENIINVGFQKDVRPYFALSDVLVFPSYREGFPNVVMQGGAMGLPAIVSNINGCNEIIKHNVNGIIIPSKDINSLLNAMDKILSDINFYSKLRDNTRDLIVSRYNRQEIWDAWSAEYKKLLMTK